MNKSGRMNAQSLTRAVGFANGFWCFFFLVAGALPPASGAESVTDWLKEAMPELTQFYKALHEAPELSHEEEKTAVKMAETLR
jgi:hypothetical protein